MLEERPGLPESVGALFDTAFSAYGKRFRFYIALALGAFAVEGLLALLRPGDVGVSQAGSVCVDAVLYGAITLGVVNDVLGEHPIADRAVLSRTFARWWALAATSAIIAMVTLVTAAAVFGPDSSDVFLALPIVVGWGSLNLASVIAATDTTTRATLLVPLSIGRSMALSLAWPNIGRTALLALIAVIPVLLQIVLDDQFRRHQYPAPSFWANVPIDALVTGPLQAVLTVFYLDFARRTAR